MRGNETREGKKCLELLTCSRQSKRKPLSRVILRRVILQKPLGQAVGPDDLLGRETR